MTKQTKLRELSEVSGPELSKEMLALISGGQANDGHWYGTYDEERKICVADHVDTQDG